MLKTHTGTRIDTARFSWSCGNWSVPYIGIAERRPGRARQMRRMVAKAKRRQRREFLARANARPAKVSAARVEVRCDGQVIGYATDLRLTLNTTPLVRVHGFSVEGPALVIPPCVDLAHEGPPNVIDVSNVPPAELDELKARLRTAIDSAKASDWRLIPLDDAPIKEGEP